MPGESSRSISYQKPAAQAFADLNRAFKQIGSVVSSSPTTMTVTGKTRYGMQGVKLRISIFERNERSCTLDVQAFGDDVWGGAARKGTDKLISALDDPNYKAGCLSMVLLFVGVTVMFAAVYHLLA